MEAEARAAAAQEESILQTICFWILPLTALLWLEINSATRNEIAVVATGEHLFPHYLNLVRLVLNTVFFAVKAEFFEMHTFARFLRRFLVIQLVIVAAFFIYVVILLRAYMVILDTFFILKLCPLHPRAGCVASLLVASARYLIEWINFLVR